MALNDVQVNVAKVHAQIAFVELIILLTWKVMSTEHSTLPHASKLVVVSITCLTDLLLPAW